MTFLSWLSSSFFYQQTHELGLTTGTDCSTVILSARDVINESVHTAKIIATCVSENNSCNLLAVYYNGMYAKVPVFLIFGNFDMIVIN